MQKIVLNDKKIINSWAMYDWANSVFSLTIATAIFPIYFNKMCKVASEAQGLVQVIEGKTIYYLNFCGMKVIGAELYSFVVSAGFLIVAFLSPLLSGIADFKQNKKFFLKVFCYMGSASCIGMYFFTANTIGLGVVLFMLSLVGFAGSIVFYNAFLPEIASEEMLDKVSAKGFSMGYIGSVILLIINLLTIMMPDMFFPIQSKAAELMAANPSLTNDLATEEAKGIYAGIATRLSFVSVGLWWAGFAQIMFKNVPEVHSNKTYDGNILNKGFEELKKVWLQVKQQPTMLKYLLGFFFTSMGVQTVMYVASLFGEEELHLDTGVLIGTILVIQLIAILGAWAFSRISAAIGNIYTLIITIVIWMIICFLAYSIRDTPEYFTIGGVQVKKVVIHFMGLGVLVGMVMGGVQSMFRSTYAKLIPEDTKDTASYFSFFDVCEKFAIVLGTFSYGLLNGITHNMRLSVVALAVYFLIGLIFVVQIKNFKSYHVSKA
jgi:UMF1 family MFS transporter